MVFVEVRVGNRKREHRRPFLDESEVDLVVEIRNRGVQEVVEVVQVLRVQRECRVPGITDGLGDIGREHGMRDASRFRHDCTGWAGFKDARGVVGDPLLLDGQTDQSPEVPAVRTGAGSQLEVEIVPHYLVG